MSRRTPERDGAAVTAEDDQLEVVNGSRRGAPAARKSAVKAVAAPEVAADAKPLAKPVAKPAAKPVAKTVGKPADKPAAKSSARTSAKSARAREAHDVTADTGTDELEVTSDDAETSDVGINAEVVADGATDPEELDADALAAKAKADAAQAAADDLPDPEAAATALRELWEGFKGTADQGLRERLILHYSPLVKYVAGRVGVGLPPNIEQADLVSYGIFGLIDAIEKFDLERAIKFETYAISRIRGAIIDELRAIDWIPRSVRYKAREVEKAYAALEGAAAPHADRVGGRRPDGHPARGPARDLQPGLVRQRRRPRRAAQRRR